MIPKEEQKQIKCYCGHTDYCDCGPLEELKQETPKTFKELFANTGIKPTTDANGIVPYNFKATLKDEPKQETLEEAAEKYANELPEPYNYGINLDKKKGFIEGAKWQAEQNNTSKVNRVEVIQHSPPYNGRAYTNYNAKNVEIQFQDDNTTLKIFLK